MFLVTLRSFSIHFTRLPICFRDIPRTPHDRLNMCSTMQEPPFARDLSPNTLRQAPDASASLGNGNQTQIPSP